MIEQVLEIIIEFLKGNSKTTYIFAVIFVTAIFGITAEQKKSKRANKGWSFNKEKTMSSNKG